MENWNHILTENDIRNIKKGDILLKTPHILKSLTQGKEEYEYYIVTNIIIDDSIIEFTLKLRNYSEIDAFIPIGKIETYILSNEIINGFWWNQKII